ncbi:MAG: phospholipid scramblase-related protein [Actinomycetota bacterium]
MTDLLNVDKLVFNQKAKLIELNTEFKIRDTQGNEIGMIRQEGQSTVKKIARLVSSLDQFMTHTLAVVNDEGVRVVELTRPRMIMKSTVLVKDGNGTDVGKIVQRNVVGKIRFGLEDAQGIEVGTLNAENWRAWNFSIKDATGVEVARITKTWEHLAKTLFTVADDYLLEVSGSPAPVLRTLILAAAVGVDLALKQGNG